MVEMGDGEMGKEDKSSKQGRREGDEGAEMDNEQIQGGAILGRVRIRRE